ncbi:hypothetical protein VSQ78_03270 [Nocardiopsis alba]|uniref:Transposase n=1 Tax=Nocardiopsis alba TaxID=53437 RepID=A0ABV5DQ42_9ACTN
MGKHTEMDKDAEFIRELIVEGTKEGLDTARAAGKRLGPLQR